jgi:hypothetical protein
LKKKSKFVVWCSAFLICCLSVSLVGVTTVFLPVSLVSVPGVYAYPDVSGNVTAALNYLNSAQAANASIGNYESSVWAVMAIVAAGQNPDAGTWVNGTGHSVVDYLIDNQDQINTTKATDVERFILAMEAAGVNSSNVNGTNYVQTLINLNDTYGANKYQIGDNTTLNDDFWGIMALLSAGVSADHWLIANSTEFIKANQRADGGWSWTMNMTHGSEVDDTSAAVMALAAAGEGSSSNVTAAVTYLQTAQNSTNGGFEYDDGVWPSSGVNADSDSWAMFAITSLGQSAFQWPLNGTDVVDHLLSLQNSNGSFNWTATSAGWTPLMTTIRAILGLRFKIVITIIIEINITIKLVGDFNNNGVLDNTGAGNDWVLLTIAIPDGPLDPYDLNGDGYVTFADRDLWDVMKTDYDSTA